MICPSCRRIVNVLKEILVIDGRTHIRLRRCDDCMVIADQMVKAEMS